MGVLPRGWAAHLTTSKYLEVESGFWGRIFLVNRQSRPNKTINPSNLCRFWILSSIWRWLRSSHSRESMRPRVQDDCGMSRSQPCASKRPPRWRKDTRRKAGADWDSSRRASLFSLHEPSQYRASAVQRSRRRTTHTRTWTAFERHEANKQDR
jgi:hypothetical protein